ncbi:ESPR-type extended signal peptide-containing protein [Acinetobacter sp. HY1485]|uniref:ESPR-type extended signal peptide-containing protein n=1 Tax=Acinetobacter sp. HY1485 TaxID=2970918 RepID=UPI0022B9CDA4|nr:ESPR-type extended signal peptide-containing protein [Acinetobacter sp. HY1485]
MNKVYRIVWNSSLGVWVVASELVKSQKKSTRAIVTAISTVAMITFSVNAFANPEVALGDGATANSTKASFISWQNPNLTTRKTDAMTGAVAIGNNANGQTNVGVAIGAESKALNNGNTFGAIAIGANAVSYNGSIALGINSLSSNSFGLAFGRESVSSGLSANAIGSTASALGDKSTAIGQSSVASGLRSLAFGAATNSKATYSDTHTEASGTDAIAIGTEAQSTGTASIAQGMQTQATAQNAIAQGTLAKATGDFSTAQGYNAAASGVSSIALGQETKALGVRSIAMGKGASTDSKTSTQNAESIAIGAFSDVSGDQSVGIGANVVASGNSSVAIGGDDVNKVIDSNGSDYTSLTGQTLQKNVYIPTTASGAGSTASGVQAKAEGAFSSAYGLAAKSTGLASLALGTYSDSEGRGSLAMGPVSKATNDGSIAVGINTTSTGKNSVAMGAGETANSGATASGENSIALGTASKGKNINTIALGNGASAANKSSIAQGTNSSATGDWAIAIGDGAKAPGKRGIAIGESASIQSKDANNTNNEQSIVIGSQSTASGNQAVALGANVTASGNSSVAIGGDDVNAVIDSSGEDFKSITGKELVKKQYRNTEAGEGATALGVQSLAKGSFATALGLTSNASGTASVALGASAESAGKGALAIGPVSQASSDGAVAVGINSKSSGKNAVAIGSGETSDAGSNASGENAIAIGNKAKAVAKQSISIGTENTVNGENSGAIGDPTTVNGKNSYSLGNNNTIDTDSTFVVGNNVTKTTTGSVALGEGSAVYAASGVEGFAQKQASDNDKTRIANTKSTQGAVSVGDSQNGIYRQITGVAAGKEDSDAVNVAQLSALDNKVDQGITFQTNGNNAQAVKPGDTVDIGTVDNEKNLTVTKNGNTIQYGLNRDLDIDSVKAGNTTLNNNGVTINNGPSMTASGIDAGNKQITNVASAGDITQATNSKHAVNAGDVNNAITSLSNKGFSISAQGNTTKDHVNLGENIDFSNGDSNIKITKGVDNQIKFNLSNQLDLSPNGSVTTGSTLLSNDGLLITNGPSVTPTGIDANNTKVINVADGDISANSKDAVNGSQLYTTNQNVTQNAGDISSLQKQTFKLQANGDTASAVKSSDTVQFKDGKNIKISRSGNDITVATTDTPEFTTVKAGDTTISSDGLKITNGPSITKDGADLAGKKITNLAAGENGTDAVNKDQLDQTAKSADNKTNNLGNSTANNLGGGSTYDPSTGTVSAPTYNITAADGSSKTPANNVGDALSSLNDEIVKPITFGGDTGKDVARNLGQKLAVTGGVTDESKLTDNNIGVIANGTDGLSVKLAKALNIESVTADDGNGNSTVLNTAGTTVTDQDGNTANYGAKQAKQTDKAGNSTVTNATGTTVSNTDGAKTIVGADNITVGEGKNPVAINGKDGVVTGLTNTTFDPNNVAADRAATEGQVSQVSTDLTNKGLNFAGNSGDTIAKKLGETLTVKGDGTKADTEYSAENVKTISKDGNLVVNIDKNAKFESVTADDGKGNSTVLNTAGTTVTDQDGNTANYGAKQAKQTDKAGNSTVTNATGSTVTDKDGNNTSTTAAGTTVSNTDGAKTTVGADNITVGEGKNPVAINGKDGVVTGLTNTTFDPNNVVADRAATEGQVSQVSTDLTNKGLNFAGNSGDTIAKKLGETLTVKGDGTKADTEYSAENVKTISKDGNLVVNIDKNAKFESVTADDGKGNSTVLNTAGTTVTDQDGNTANYGAKQAKQTDKAGNSTVTNATGSTVTDKDGNNTSTTAVGTTVSNTDGAKTTVGADNITVGEGKNPIAINGKDGVVTGLTNTTFDPNNVVADRAATEGQVSQVSTDLTNKGLNFAGNSGDTIAKKLGETLTVKGDGTKADTEYSAENVKTISKDGNLVVNIDKNAKFESVTADDGNGNSTVLNTAGTTVTDQDGNTANYGAKQAKQTDKAGNSTVTNATGSTVTDKDGNNTATTAAGTTVSNTDGAKTTVGADNITVGEGKNPVAINGKDGVVTGLTNTTFDPNNVVADRAATEGQVSQVSTDLTNKGLNFAGNSGDTIAKKLGETLTVKGDGTKADTEYSAENVKTISKDGNLVVNIDKNAKFDSINTGGTLLNKDGLSFVDSNGNVVANTPSIKSAGIDAGNQKVTNVADGAITKDSKDAVNGGQLSTLSDNAVQYAKNDDGTPNYDKISAGNGKGTPAQIGTDVNGNNIVTSGGTSLSNVANGVNPDDAVNKGQLDQLAKSSDDKANNLGNSTANNLGGGSTYDPSTGTVSAPTYNITAADGSSKTPANNVGDALSSLNDEIVKPITFGGDTGKDVARNLGQKLAVTGGVTDESKLTDNNIGVIANGTDGLSVKLAKALNIESVTADDGNGNSTVLNTAGTTVTDQDGNTANYGAKQAKQTDKAGNSTVTNATGSTVTDKDGNNTSTTAAGTTVSNTEGAKTTVGADSITVGEGKNPVAINGKDGVVTGLTNTTWDPNNVVADRAATEGQVKQATENATSNITKAGLNFAANSGNNVHKNLGETLTIKGNGAKADTEYSADNIKTMTDADGNLVVNLDKNSSFDSVNADGTLLNQNGLSFVDSNGNVVANTPSIKPSGIDAGNQKITNVADGAIAKDSKDAVNGGQLSTLSDNAVQYAKNDDGTPNYDKIAAGNGKGTPVQTGQDSKGNNIVTSGGTSISNVANGVNPDDAVNKGQLDSVLSQNVTNVTDGEGNQINIGNQIVNKNPNNSNSDSLFLTYDKSGQETTDRLTIGQTVQKMNTEGVKYSHTNGTTEAGVVGSTNDSSAGAENSTAIGVNAIIKDGATSTIALGHNTQASTDATNSVVIGQSSNVSGASSVAIGHGATASGTQSISIGTGNTVSGNNSGAFGDPSVINGNSSYSVGNNNTVSTDDTFVLGNNVTNTTAGSVVLGTNSAARTGADVVGYSLNIANQDDVAAIEATKSTTGAVSVGDANNGIYRQITGVAAGTQNSDAVNVAQLKAVDNKLDTSTKAIANIFGGGAAVGSNGEVTAPSYNVASDNYNNVGDALSALDTAIQNTTTAATKAKSTVTAGNNIEIAESTNTDGSTNYQVATAKDLNIDSVTSQDSAGNKTVLSATGTQVADGNNNVANYGATTTLQDQAGNNVVINASGITAKTATGTGTALTGAGLSFYDANGNVTGPSVNASGIDAGGQKVTNVAAGTNTTDAVNKGQLDQVQNQVTNLNNGKAGLVQQENNTAPITVAKDTGGTVVDFTGTDGARQLTGVADGKVTAGSKDAVNGNQLANVSGSVANAIGGNTTVNADGTVTTSNVGGTGKDNINDAIASVNTAATKAKSTVSAGKNITVTEGQNTDGSTNYQVETAKDLSVDSVTATDSAGNSTIVNSSGLHFNDASGNKTGASVTASGVDAGSQKVTNVANGAIQKDSGDAVNGGQIYTANTNVATYLGGGAAVGSDGQVSAPTYNVANGSYNNVGDALTAVDNRVGNVENKVNQAFAYTNNRINKVEDKLSAGIAATAALENAPYVAGKWTYAAGASYYNNQGAVGATLRRTADNGRWSMTGGIAGGTEGSPLVRVGISGVIN